MSNLIGRFYFKLTDSKNLIGEFSNSSDERIYAESADRIIPVTDEEMFTGEYFTTWCHYYKNGNVEGIVAKLKIMRKPQSQNTFSLTWSVQDGKNAGISFWGEGMLCDGMLIGDYRNFPTP
jgi:hypothetical protein